MSVPLPDAVTTYAACSPVRCVSWGGYMDWITGCAISGELAQWTNEIARMSRLYVPFIGGNARAAGFATLRLQGYSEVDNNVSKNDGQATLFVFEKRLLRHRWYEGR